MKKFIIAIIVAAGIVGLVLLTHFKAKSPTTAANTTPVQTTPLDTTSTASATPAPSSYKDGNYTGTAVDNGYGIVQVEAIVSGGKLTDVKFLSMPSGGHSSEVAAFAEPQLLNEALTKQSAKVDIVSGATQDSEAFAQSLQAALSQAS